MHKPRRPKPGQKIVDGLYRGDDGAFRYRYMFRGQLFTGNTELTDENEAREFLKDHRTLVDLSLRGKIAGPDLQGAGSKQASDSAEAESPKTLRDILDLWERTKRLVRSHSHVNTTVSSIRKHFDDLLDRPAKDLTGMDINNCTRRYLDSKGWNPGRGGKGWYQDHTPQGANKLLRRLRDVIAFGVENGLIQKRPCRIDYVQAEKIQRPTLSLELVDKFLTVVDRARNPHLGIACRLAIFLGLREKECLNVSWTGVHWRSNKLYPDVTKTGDGKGVAMPRILREYLWNHPDRKSSGLILPSCRSPKGGEEAPYQAGFTSEIVQVAWWHIQLDTFLPKDIKELLARIDQCRDQNIRTLSRLILGLGLPESVARSLRWEQIGLSNSTCTLLAHQGAETVLPVPGWLLDHLQALHPEDKERFIIDVPRGRHRGNGVFRSGAATIAIRRAWRAMRFPRLSPHRLRASFATIHAKDLRTDITMISRMMRHQSLETTRAYIEIDDQAHQAAQNGWPEFSE